MKITAIETLAADGGYRQCRYVKLSTDEGLTGWSEYYESLSGVSVTPVIGHLARQAVGTDPTAFGLLSESLLASTRLSSGGLAHQAVAAIENACLDVAGKARGPASRPWHIAMPSGRAATIPSDQGPLPRFSYSSLAELPRVGAQLRLVDPQFRRHVHD